MKQTDPLLQLCLHLYTFVAKLYRNPGWGRFSSPFGDEASRVTAGAYSFFKEAFSKGKYYTVVQRDFPPPVFHGKNFPAPQSKGMSHQYLVAK